MKKVYEVYQDNKIIEINSNREESEYVIAECIIRFGNKSVYEIKERITDHDNKTIIK